MDVAISVVRPFHVVKMANALSRHASRVGIWTSAPRRSFRHLDTAIQTHFVPAPVELITHILKVRFSPNAYQRGIVWWDRMVGLTVPRSGVVIGFATQSLHTGQAAHRRGSRFALDRACPHVDVQQALVAAESEKVGGQHTPEPAWFRERQLAEYEEADTILVPSRYTAASFPAHLRHKLLLAPLLGRAEAKGEIRYERNVPFTVGVLGGHPLRKGYLYLLEAWKRLALPHARLLIRSSGDFSQYPRLQELLRSTPNVEIIEYVPNIAEFYQRCDLFVLPSVDDGFGMALFEAMANGVPTVSTRNCGASELLTDGIDGLIIDPADVDQLASAIAVLYEDEERRQAIARAGAHTAQRISQSTLYEEALVRLLGATQPAAAVA